jgi:hypothetical protein
MAKGDHLLIHMDLFTHHGIDAGDGTVVHWANSNGQGVNPLTKEGAAIQQTSYADFAAGKLVNVWNDATSFDADTVVSRSLNCLGQQGYNLAHNNCEHFASWCRTGEPWSEQVKNVATLITGISAIQTGIAGGVGVVSAAGPVAGLGKAGTIAGLSAVGRVLGGGPALGLCMLVGLPAVASVFTLGSLFNDHLTLPPDERKAREVARTAGIGGAVAGMAAVLGAVAAAGIPGLGADGLTSGLAAIGGGSIGLGLAIILALPAVVALGGAWMVYRLCRQAIPA